MTRILRFRALFAGVAALSLMSVTPASAQLTVYDPTN
jgi:hypothetical protein